MKWFTRSILAKVCFLVLVACSSRTAPTNIWNLADHTEVQTPEGQTLIIAPIGPAEASTEGNPFVGYYVVLKVTSPVNGQTSLIVSPIEKFFHLELTGYEVGDLQYLMVYEVNPQPGRVIYPIDYLAESVMNSLCLSSAESEQATPLCY